MTIDSGRTVYGGGGIGSGDGVPANGREQVGLMATSVVANITAGNGAVIVFDADSSANGSSASGLDCEVDNSGPVVLTAGLYGFCVSADADQPFYLAVNSGGATGNDAELVSHPSVSGTYHAVVAEFMAGLLPEAPIGFIMYNPAGGSTITSASIYVQLEAWRVI
jgi:hypothetical protein